MDKKKKKGTQEGDRQSHVEAESGQNPSTPTGKVEGDVIYRKEGSKIVPVSPATDQIEAPVSELFSQFTNLTESSATRSLSRRDTPETTSSESTYLSTLTIKDVLPSDRLLEHLLNEENPGVGVDETKKLVQTVLDVLPLKEDDPKRIQAQKEFLKECKAKKIQGREIANWSLKYTSDGAALAFALFKILIDDGDHASCYSYGVLLYRGAKGVPADPVKGRAIIESITKPRPHVPSYARYHAQMVMGSIYAREDKNYEAAREMYQAASSAGLVGAKVSLGRMYLSGELPKDPTKAKKYFDQAIAIEENRDAYFLLGVLEMEKEKPNIDTVFRNFEKAASKGLPEAQYNLGLAYFRGAGVPKNDALAVEYWKMAGQQGFGLAQLSLGSYYFQDETPIVQKDPKTGEVKLFKHEWDSSKRDLMQAQKWFTLASRRPGDLGLEGKRLKARVDEAIRKGDGRSRDGRSCIIM
ncbi:hypothetical protein BGX34_006693 [Mortierella sp. NVP85]|nr:hypothetical protein BGX34_006693 [Mortierella sp. NVP85]